MTVHVSNVQPTGLTLYVLSSSVTILWSSRSRDRSDLVTTNLSGFLSNQ